MIGHGVLQLYYYEYNIDKDSLVGRLVHENSCHLLAVFQGLIPIMCRYGIGGEVIRYVNHKRVRFT